MTDNYKELIDSLDEWSCDSFFGSIDPNSYDDKTLKKLLIKTDQAYWKLRDYLDKMVERIN